MGIDAIIWNNLMMTFGNVGLVTALVMILLAALMLVVFPSFSPVVYIPLVTILLFMGLYAIISPSVIMSVVGVLSIAVVILLIVRVLLSATNG